MNLYKKKKGIAILIQNMPEPIHHGLKAKAAMEGKSMRSVILALITQYIKETKE